MRKPIGVFDVETDPFKAGRMPQPFLCGFYDGKTYRDFAGSDCIKKCFAVMRKFEGYIYAHNGGKFDFKFLLPLIPKNEVKVFVVKGRLSKIAFRGVEFRDSYLMLPIPLKAYGKLEIDYRKFEAGRREKCMAEIRTYLKADCYYLFQMVGEFVAEYGFGLTLAGRTFHQLKTKFDITPPKTDERYDDQFREFYYGGRVEFFELGRLKGKFQIFDINSAYPRAMMEKHVFGTAFQVGTKLPKSEAELKRCFVKFEGESTGGLPFRAKDKSLSFAPREGEFAATGWELQAAMAAGRVKIKRVVVCYRPTECRDFSRYVEHFYKLKQAAKKGSGEQVFAKLMLNSCYGRFALNPREFKDVCLTEYGEEPDENREARKEDEPEPWSLANDFEDAGISIWEKLAYVAHNAFFNVATAASITGWVRAFLYEAINRVQRPVYCDTDSLVCAHPRGLQIGDGLGAWKREGVCQRDSVWIAGKKLYAAKLESGDWKFASKGVRISPQEICRIAEGEDITSTFEAPSFSLINGEGFVTRTVRRDDRRKRRKIAC